MMENMPLLYSHSYVWKVYLGQSYKYTVAQMMGKSKKSSYLNRLHAVLIQST